AFLILVNYRDYGTCRDGSQAGSIPSQQMITAVGALQQNGCGGTAASWAAPSPSGGCTHDVPKSPNGGNGYAAGSSAVHAGTAGRTSALPGPEKRPIDGSVP